MSIENKYLKDVRRKTLAKINVYLYTKNLIQERLSGTQTHEYDPSKYENYFTRLVKKENFQRLQTISKQNPKVSCEMLINLVKTIIS